MWVDALINALGYLIVVFGLACVLFFWFYISEQSGLTKFNFFTIYDKPRKKAKVYKQVKQQKS